MNVSKGTIGDFFLKRRDTLNAVGTKIVTEGKTSTNRHSLLQTSHAGKPALY